MKLEKQLLGLLLSTPNTKKIKIISEELEMKSEFNQT